MTLSDIKIGHKILAIVIVFCTTEAAISIWHHHTLSEVQRRYERAAETDARIMVARLDTSAHTAIHATRSETSAVGRWLHQRTRLTIMVSAGLTLLIGAGAGLVILADYKRLNRLANQMNAIVVGDLTQTVEGQDRDDEIGHLAKTIHTFKTEAAKARRSRQENTLFLD